MAVTLTVYPSQGGVENGWSRDLRGPSPSPSPSPAEANAAAPAAKSDFERVSVHNM